MDEATDNGPTAETPSETIHNHLAEREQAISAALRGISQTIIAADGDIPPDLNELVGHGLTLIYCGLMALSEIAAAQTEMVALAKRDFAAEVEEAAKPKAAMMAQEIKDSETKRSFIGSKG